MRCLYAFGANRNGQLGIGDTVAYTVSPVRISLPTTDDIVDVAAGSYHTVCVLTNGDVHGWGQNQYGQLGVDPATCPMSATPLRINVDFFAIRVACGEGHTVFLSRTHCVYVCGAKRRASQPMRRVLSSGQGSIGKVVSIYAGADTSFALTSQGNLYAWGVGVPGMLFSSEPTRVIVDTSAADTAQPAVVKVVASRKHCLALTVRGDVWVVGSGDSGELGLGRSIRVVHAWSPLTTTTSGGLTDICVGHNHTVLLSSEGSVGVCGHPAGGRLGLGPNACEVCTPLTIPSFEGVDIVGIAAGAAFTLAWSHHGKLYAWGSNSNGQLGTAPVCKFKDEPTLVDALWPSTWRIVRCAAGESHSIVLVTDVPLDYPQPHFLQITCTPTPSFASAREGPVSVVPDEIVNLSFGRRSAAAPAVSPVGSFAKTCPPQDKGFAYGKEVLGALVVLGVTILGTFMRRHKQS